MITQTTPYICSADTTRAYFAPVNLADDPKNVPTEDGSRKRRCRNKGGTKFEIVDEICRLFLPCGRVALIDADDASRVVAHLWYWDGRYVRGGSLEIGLHRFILNAPAGTPVDHIRWNTLDNRKSKLRLCSFSENAINRHPRHIGGVKFMRDAKRKRPWRATWRRKTLGDFAAESEAIDAIERRREAELAALEGARA